LATIEQESMLLFKDADIENIKEGWEKVLYYH
jgi:hypothetical protein